MTLHCAMCGEEVTAPHWHQGKPYGYTCITKVNPSAKKGPGLQWIEVPFIDVSKCRASHKDPEISVSLRSGLSGRIVEGKFYLPVKEINPELVTHKKGNFGFRFTSNRRIGYILINDKWYQYFEAF